MTPNPTSGPEIESGPPATNDAVIDTAPLIEDTTVADTEPAAKDRAAQDEAVENQAETKADTQATEGQAPATTPDRSAADSTPAAEAVAGPADAEPAAAEPAAEPAAAEPAAVEPVPAAPVPAAAPAAPAAATPPSLQTSWARPAGSVPPATPVEPAAVTTPVVVPAGSTEPTPEVLAVGDEEEFVDEGYAEVTPGNGYPTLVPFVGALVGLAAVISLLIAAFVLPAQNSGPHKLPIGVAGAPATTSQVAALFSTGSTAKAFDVHIYGTEAALRTAIKHRKVYGGLSVTTTGGSMLVASAASPTVASTLQTVANELSSQAQIPVTDIVPLPHSDRLGAGLAAIALPLGIAGLLPALLVIQLYRRRTLAQVGVALAGSVATGLALSAVLTFWLKATQGANYWLLTLGLAAGIAAVSLLVLGLYTLAGRIAAGVGIAVLLLISVPLSGLSTAPEWYPKPWDTIGRLLPAGASGTLLRSTAFFHGHGGLDALLVLGIWALVGLLLLLVGTFVNDRRTGTVEVVEVVPA